MRSDEVERALIRNESACGKEIFVVHQNGCVQWFILKEFPASHSAGGEVPYRGSYFTAFSGCHKNFSAGELRPKPFD